MTNPDRRRLLLAAAGALAAGSAWSRALAREADHDHHPDAHDDGEGPLPKILAETGAPALTGGVVTRDGLIHAHSAGVRRLGGPDMVTAGDLWHLGSNSKAMTAALYGRLVDQGRARWGATVPQLFPDLTIDPAWKDTTVEQLMGHRAGVEERAALQGGWLMKAHGDARPVVAQRTDVAAGVFSKPPGGKPGEFVYANFNYVLVGAAIERITGQSWEDAIQAQLFRPLGVTTAGFGAPQGANPWGHRPAKAGAQPLPVALVPVDPAGIADNPAAMGPAGRVHMSLPDYARFIRLFLTRGDGVLTPETVIRLTTPAPGEGRAYALGWGVRTEGSGVVLAHEGSNTLWHAIAAISPATGIALIGASNSPPPVQAASRFLKHMQDEFLGT